MGTGNLERLEALERLDILENLEILEELENLVRRYTMLSDVETTIVGFRLHVSCVDSQPDTVKHRKTYIRWLLRRGSTSSHSEQRS